MKRLLVAGLVVLAGCGSAGRSPRSAPPAAQITTMAMPAFLRVSGRPSGSFVAVAWRNGVTTISSRLGGVRVTISGKAGRYTHDGRLVVLAKTYRDGVRLRTVRGRTLWRVRIAGSRVQIRRGETDVRYDFRRYGDDRIIVRQGMFLVGSVRAVEQGAEVVDARGVRLGASFSPPGNDMAMLLCREVPPDLRAILTAVMLRRR